MKRAATYGLIASLTVALIGAGALVAAWLAGTTDGARRLMAAVSRHTPLTISARTIEGRLLDRLQLGGVRLALPPVEVTIERLDLHWQPLRLLTGHVAAKGLTLAGVQIRDNSPDDGPPDLAWPRISGIATFFDGAIDRLRVNGLTYRRPGREPVNVTTISSSVAWRNTLLSLSDFTVVAPAGRVTGNITAGFFLPSLRFDLEATPAEPITGMDTPHPSCPAPSRAAPRAARGGLHRGRRVRQSEALGAHGRGGDDFAGLQYEAAPPDPTGPPRCGHRKGNRHADRP